jgi:N-acetylmuramoyl-L-alanine amidase
MPVAFHRACRVLCLVALLGIAPSPVRAADVPLVSHQGRPYVPLSSVAAVLKAGATPISGNARMRMTVGRNVLVVTRDSPRVLVNGRPVALSSPVAVVAGRRWLVPADFLTSVVPRVASGVRIVAVPAPRSSVDGVSTAAVKRVPPAPAGRQVVEETGAGRRAKTARAPASTAEPAQNGRAVEVTRGAAASAGARLADLRARSYPAYTRVVVEADAPFAYRIEPAGDDLRIRLEGLDVGEPRIATIQDGLVRDARLAGEAGRSTLTVSLERPVGDIRPTTLTSPFRLVLDVPRSASSPPAAPPERGAAGALRHIVLDAGHGGQDPGAIGPTGLMEKDVVLDIARRVARLLRSRLNVKVTLTRDDDVFVPLRDRTSFANRERADLFISIHANAHHDIASEGVETYFLSLEATDNAARQVAERENEVVSLETLAAPAAADGLRALLWDLSQNAFVEESSNLAEVVQDSMSESLGIPNRGVKQAGFYVLGGAAMPAVLIETGFVTNRREERRLRQSRYREELARAIFAGLSAYKQRYDQRMQAGMQQGAR